VSYLSQQANSLGVALDELAITPGQVARVIALVAGGELTTSWPARSSTVCSRRG